MERRFHGFNWRAAWRRSIEYPHFSHIDQKMAEPDWIHTEDELAKHAALSGWAEKHLGPGTAVIGYGIDVDPHYGDYGEGGWIDHGQRLTLSVDYLVEGLGDERGKPFNSTADDEDAAKHITEIIEALLSAGRKD